MKSPQNQRPDDQAREDTEEFIRTYHRMSKAAQAARKTKDAEKAAK
jgi:myo-inositol-1-phosphate synthase